MIGLLQSIAVWVEALVEDLRIAEHKDHEMAGMTFLGSALGHGQSIM